jgi:hypothetical protein
MPSNAAEIGHISVDCWLRIDGEVGMVSAVSIAGEGAEGEVQTAVDPVSGEN